MKQPDKRKGQIPVTSCTVCIVREITGERAKKQCALATAQGSVQAPLVDALIFTMGEIFVTRDPFFFWGFLELRTCNKFTDYSEKKSMSRVGPLRSLSCKSESLGSTSSAASPDNEKYLSKIICSE